MSYFRENIDALSAYVPGEQPAEGQDVVKLNTNENPYPPSPRAMAAMKEISDDSLRRYPDPQAGRFAAAAGEVLGVPAGWILVGNGSDEILTMAFRACCQPGRAVVYPAPTYVLYRTLGQIQAAECIEAPFDEDYNLPVDALAEAAGALTIVSRPNSPSGTAWPIDVLDDLAGRLAGLLVIDEAYVDFAGDDALPLVRRHGNVLVLRTLSKGYSLAGLRLGFAVGNPEALAGLMKVKDSYNVSAAACAVGVEAVRDQAWKQANADKVRASRAKLASALERLGWKVWASQANFLLARPADGQARRVYNLLKDNGVLVRYFPKQPALDDKLRITVGTDQQNGALLAVL